MLTGMATIVRFNGREIWLRRAAAEMGMDPAMLSRILSGKRDPLKLWGGTLQKLKVAFGFKTIDALVEAIEARRRVAATSDAHEGDRASHSSALSPSL